MPVGFGAGSVCKYLAVHPWATGVHFKGKYSRADHQPGLLYIQISLSNTHHRLQPLTSASTAFNFSPRVNKLSFRKLIDYIQVFLRASCSSSLIEAEFRHERLQQHTCNGNVLQ